nr:hypothetical protein [Thalassobacillus sp. CUG 92003]
MDSKRVVSHDMEVSEPLDQKEAAEFITKQLEKGAWWFLEDGVALRTGRVEAFYLDKSAHQTHFSLD